MTDTLKADIFTTLRDNATIGALIGDNIFPDRADQKVALPYITYDLSSEQDVHHQEGDGNKAMTEIQFNVWAATSESRTAIKQALRDIFAGKIRQTFGSTFCQSVRNTNNTDTTEDPIDSSQDYVFGVFMDFQFWHNN